MAVAGYHIFGGSQAPWHQIPHPLQQHAGLPPWGSDLTSGRSACVIDINRTEEEMAPQMTRTDEQAQIRALINNWMRAARANDIDGVMAAYAPDIRSFDAIAELQFEGIDAYRKHWEACMAMCPSPIFEIHDLEIEAGEGVAFGHYLLRCGATGSDGKEQTGWMRVTVCLRKTHGKWQVAHEHFSAPFDPQSGKALLELQP